MLTFEEAKTQIVEIITDASGVTINNEIIFDLADSNGLKDLIKNSMIKDKLLMSPEILLKKDSTLYMYDSSVIDIKVKPEGIEIDWHNSITSMLPAEAEAEEEGEAEAEAEAEEEGEAEAEEEGEAEGEEKRTILKADKYWSFMVCKAIIRKLHTHSAYKPNFRSHSSLLHFLANKYNMSVERLVETNPINLIPFKVLKTILSSYTLAFLWDKA